MVAKLQGAELDIKARELWRLTYCSGKVPSLRVRHLQRGPGTGDQSYWSNASGKV